MAKFFTFILVAFVLLSETAQAKIYIDITRASNRSFPLALVPPLLEGAPADPKNLGKLFSDTVQKDLEMMGVFRFIPENAFLESPTKKAHSAKDIDFASWAVLDALGLIKATYEIKGERVIFEPRLFDVLLQKELLAKRYEADSNLVSSVAHRFANEIIQVLTGETGLFETQIAFVAQAGKNKELYVIDFNGENLRKLTNHKSIVMSPSWNADGTAIYYTAFGQNGKPPQLYRHDMKTDKNVRISSFPRMVIGTSLHPSHELIATALTKDGNSEIYLLNFEGNVVERLTRNFATDVNPSFSPDGKDLVFVSDRDGSVQIYRRKSEGNERARRLTYRGLNNTAPDWSPKGDRILFSGMDTDGFFDVFSMNREGGDMIRLTYDSKNNEEPSWSPDGQLIVFCSNREGQYHLYSMRADGTHQIRLTHKPWRHAMPTWGPKS